jgi:hypothetical protein
MKKQEQALAWLMMKQQEVEAWGQQAQDGAN